MIRKLVLPLLLVSLLGAPSADAAPAQARCGAPYTGDGRDYQAASPSAPNPLAGEQWFVDPDEESVNDWVELFSAGDTERATLMAKLAFQPKFRWFGTFSKPDVGTRVRAYIDKATCQPGSVPLLAPLRAESNSCSKGYGGGSKAEDARTRRWYDQFAAAVGNARVIIAFEPDSLGTVDCIRKNRRPARLRLLRYGLGVMSRLPNATVYMEAGASDWVPAGKMARLLRAVGVGRVRGFMLNATHEDWTGANIRYGRRLSSAVGGKPFVINTSDNGQGPLVTFKTVGGRRVRRNEWCNPPRRGLGPVPTTDTHDSKVDAYLWIGRPGYSGGACNGGPTPAGSWWRERALELARLASERIN